MFYCRNEELRKLNKRYDAGNFECIVIYGRRRVGKTTIINEFCKGKPTVFFSALLEGTAKDNLKTLSRAIYTYNQPDATDAPEYNSFDSALNEITRLAENERIVFVIDEYPYLAKSYPSISSRLQHLIDHTWKDSKLFLILCGSSMSFMENQVLGYQSPLYGRRTGQFKIEPLTYKETAVFNPELDNVTNAFVYGVTGGIPHYINKLNVQGDFDNALLMGRSLGTAIVFAIGGVLGFLIIAKIIAKLLLKYEAQVYYGVAGMVAGAAVILFAQGVLLDDRFKGIFTGAGLSGGIVGLLVIDVLLIAIGVICTLFLDDDSELVQKMKNKGKLRKE